MVEHISATTRYSGEGSDVRQVRPGQTDLQTCAIGFGTWAHLDETVPAADIDHSEANLNQIDVALADAVPVRGPHV